MEQRSEKAKFCHWTPVMVSRCVRPHRVPIRSGFGIPDALGYVPPREGSLLGKGCCLPCSWGLAKKCSYPSKKVLSKMLLEAPHLRREFTQRVHPNICFTEQKKSRGLYDPRETRGSVQDLVAASCLCRVDSVQMPKVCPNNSLVQLALTGREISLLICMKAGWIYC